jgi:hemerythrin-like domain-containing protein
MTDSQQDVIEVLTTDHTEATSLIAQIRGSSDAEERRDLADTLISELVRHSVAEEMFVYPAMKEHLPDGDQAVEHDVEEHKQLERIMKELEGAEASDPSFDGLITQLETVLRDHVQDEETEQFPKLRASLPQEKLVSLAERVETAKKVAPTRPHPGAPNNEVFHKLVGPGVGLVDRLRDKLAGRSS